MIEKIKEKAEIIPDSVAVYVGIDPDNDKSGVGMWRPSDMGFALDNLSFFDLFEYLRENKHQIRLVVIEAGWLNKSVWHGAYSKGAGVAARIGKNVGSNHETGRKIEEMCTYLGLPYELTRPRSRKIPAEEFKRVTHIAMRTNQEQRDAFMLVWGRR